MRVDQQNPQNPVFLLPNKVRSTKSTEVRTACILSFSWVRADDRFG